MSMQQLQLNITRNILTKNRYRIVLLPRSFEWNKSHHTVLLLRFMFKNTKIKLRTKMKPISTESQCSWTKRAEETKHRSLETKHKIKQNKKTMPFDDAETGRSSCYNQFFFYSILYTKYLLSGQAEKKNRKVLVKMIGPMRFLNFLRVSRHFQQSILYRHNTFIALYLSDNFDLRLKHQTHRNKI